MTQEEKEWTPLPRPCLVCLTKKKVDHDDTKPSRPTQGPTMTDAEFINNQTDIINTFTDKLVKINKDNSDQLEQCGDMSVNILNVEVGKTQTCLSLKRAANFANPKHHSSSAKNVCNKKTLMNSKVKQQDLMRQQTFKPVLKDQSTLFSQSSITKFDTKKQKSKELAIQSTSKQASNLSLFQKKCSANKIVEKSKVNDIKTDDGLKLCPLCQMEFPISWTQIEKDGHIASCLSETSDDVIW